VFYTGYHECGWQQEDGPNPAEQARCHLNTHWTMAEKLWVKHTAEERTAAFHDCPQETLVDSRTDPANLNNWFVDHPQEDLQGTSIVSQDPQGLLSFLQRLLDRMALNGIYFMKSQGTLVANKSKSMVMPSRAFLILWQRS